MASYIYKDVAPSGRNLDGMPCKCCRLDTGCDLPSPRPLELGQTQSLANTFAHEIFSDWANLNAILKRFEGLVRKRWLEKSAKQRREALVGANPTIPLVHRPDFENFRNYGNRHISRSRTCDAGAHLTPYINLEDLMQGHNLLLLVNSRGRNLPWIFTAADGDKAHLSHGWQERPKKRAEFAISFYDKKTPRQYASIVKVSALPRKTGTAHSVTPAYGLLTLEIQQSIYRFLLRCVKLILHDVEPVLFRLAPYQTEPSPLQDPTGIWQSVSKQTLEADYCKPQYAGLARFQNMALGLRLIAEDHIWSLLEDPSYFLDHLKEWREYRDSCLKDTPTHWRYVASSMLAHAMDSLCTYTWLTDIFAGMRTLGDQIASASRSTLRLSQWDEFMWVVIAKVIESLIWKCMQNLNITIPKSSGFRSYVHAPHNPATCKFKGECPFGCESSWNLKRSSTPAHTRAHKIFLMLSGNDPHAVQLHRLRPIVQEAHYMLEQDSEASRLIDTCLLKDFFDLAVLVDIQYDIHALRPYTGLEEDCYVNTTEEKFFMKRADLREAIMFAVTETKCLGDPLDGRFSYPVDKRRTAETVNQMQQAESTLKTFWNQVHKGARRYGINLDAFFAWHLISSPSAVHTTQDWHEKEADTMRAPTRHSGRSRFEHDLGEAHRSPIVKENKKAEITPESKIKTKTRGALQDQLPFPPQPNPILPPARPANANTLPDTHLKPIKLPRQAHRILSALLPTPGTISSAPREISWTDFLCTLNTLGLVPEKLYGSVWIFRPTPLDQPALVRVERSIQFHEPKEVRRGNKISVLMVRRFGDRLKRAFGWEGEMFGVA